MRKLLIFLLPLLLYTSCNRQQPRHIIGVSQCSADIWREKQNAEMRMETYLQEDIELRFAAAHDSDERQVQQIDSLVKTGIDLLIVAPNQVQTITPAIDKAYDSGIPVIVFERKTSSKKYTAFISADNYEMGRTMGEYIAKQMSGKGRVMEIMGLKGSSPAIERHKGFADALSHYPDIQLAATLQGDWTEESAVKATEQWLSQQSSLQPIDFVFAQNDRMAIGARRTAANSPLFTQQFSHTKYCGIDGLPGKDGGIQQVLDSVLDATYIYPTHGDQVLDLAVAILDGKPYDKEVMLKSALVTRDNASALLMQSEETMRQTEWLDQLHAKADSYLHELDTQRLLTLALTVIIVMVIVSAAFVVISMRRRHNLERQAFSLVTSPATTQAEIITPPAAKTEAATPATTNTETTSQDTTNNEEPTDAEAETGNQSDDSLPAQPSSTTGNKPEITDVTPEEQADIEAEADADSHFLERLRSHVQEEMSDTDFSVETLAAQMGMSRVQLYRKVKLLTGRTPVDIIRLSRLNRSKVLLAQEGTTISEVAYSIGFSSPSYFTKCFKDEFGILPGDIKKE